VTILSSPTPNSARAAVTASASREKRLAAAVDRAGRGEPMFAEAKASEAA